MKGLIKKFDYKTKTITIAVDDVRIKDDIEYVFEHIDEMNAIDNKFLVYLDKITFKNGKVEFKNIRFDEFKIDDIIVNSIIGNGDNGVVYQGYDTFFERNVAIKVWLPNFKNGKKKSNKTRFKEEVKKMANINQQSVTTIHKRDKIFSFDLVIMELINGITLKKWLSYKPNFYDRCIVIRALFLEIEKLHQDGIHHGDLHLENIMVDSVRGMLNKNKKSNLIYIIDFGTSIFSGKNNSNERECKLMIDTFNEIIHEIKEYNILDLDKNSSSSEMIIKIYRGIINLLSLLKLESMSHQAIVDISMLTTVLPVYNLKSLSNLIENKLKSDENYSIEDFKVYLANYLFYMSDIFDIDINEIKNITIGEAYDKYKNVFNNKLKEKGYKEILEILNQVNDFETVLNLNI